MVGSLVVWLTVAELFKMLEEKTEDLLLELDGETDTADGEVELDVIPPGGACQATMAVVVKDDNDAADEEVELDVRALDVACQATITVVVKDDDAADEETTETEDAAEDLCELEEVEAFLVVGNFSWTLVTDIAMVAEELLQTAETHL